MKLLNYKQFNESKQDIDSICEKYGIKNYTINHDGSIDVDGDVNLINKGLTKLPLKFRNVSGDFHCQNNQLVSLEGAPTSVGGGFYCSNNQLTSLEGSPTSGGYFVCSNNKLTTLEGAPTSVGGYFWCSNNKLVSLEGAPESMGGNFDCSNNKLVHFEGFPPLYDKTKKIFCRGNPVEEIYSLYDTIECAEWLNEEEVINYKNVDRPFVYYMKLTDVYDYLEMEPLDIDQVRSRLKHYEVIG